MDPRQPGSLGKAARSGMTGDMVEALEFRRGAA